MLAITIAAAVSAPAPAALKEDSPVPTLTIVVNAGPHDRVNCPVSVALPEDADNARLTVNMR